MTAVTAAVSAVVTALGVVASILKLTENRWTKPREQIRETRVLAEEFAEGSETRAKLLEHADRLSDDLITRQTAAMSAPRLWDSIFLAAAIAIGFGYWASQAPFLWLQIPLWTLAIVAGAALFGLLSPRRQDTSRSRRPSVERPTAPPLRSAS